MLQVESQEPVPENDDKIDENVAAYASLVRAGENACVERWKFLYNLWLTSNSRRSIDRVLKDAQSMLAEEGYELSISAELKSMLGFRWWKTHFPTAGDLRPNIKKCREAHRSYRQLQDISDYCGEGEPTSEVTVWSDAGRPLPATPQSKHPVQTCDQMFGGESKVIVPTLVKERLDELILDPACSAASWRKQFLSEFPQLKDSGGPGASAPNCVQKLEASVAGLGAMAFHKMRPDELRDLHARCEDSGIRLADVIQATETLMQELDMPLDPMEERVSSPTVAIGVISELRAQSRLLEKSECRSEDDRSHIGAMMTFYSEVIAIARAGRSKCQALLGLEEAAA